MKDLIDTTEMYLRTIFELEEEGIPPMRARIAERLGHSGPTVSQTIARMERDGLVSLGEDRRLVLSDEGRLLATRVMRKHRLAERLLADVIGLEWEHIHDEACRWEHVMSEQVERRLVRMLPEHRTSPYGNPIPGLAELDADVPAGVFVEPLSAACPGEGRAEVRIEWLAEPLQVDTYLLAQLRDTGILPGVTVTCEPAGEYITLRAPEAATVLDLPIETAQNVFVSRSDTAS